MNPMLDNLVGRAEARFSSELEIEYLHLTVVAALAEDLLKATAVGGSPSNSESLYQTLKTITMTPSGTLYHSCIALSNKT